MSVVPKNAARAERVPRLRATIRVTESLADMVRRGELQSARPGNARPGLVPFRIQWQLEREFRFLLDLDADAVKLPAFLPAPLPPRLLRDLQFFLRTGPDKELRDSQNHAGPGGELRLFVQHGAITLSNTVTDGAYESCTEQLIQLGGRILNGYLRQPAYLGYLLRHVANRPLDIGRRASTNSAMG